MDGIGCEAIASARGLFDSEWMTGGRVVNTGRSQVVIVGGGFARLACALNLAKHHDVRVTLIDNRSYNLSPP